MGGVTVASAKQLQSQLEKLTAKIQTRQTELTELKSKHKDVKTQLADARKAAKEKAQAPKAK